MWCGTDEGVRAFLQYQKEEKYELAQEAILDARRRNVPMAHQILTYLHSRGGCMFTADMKYSPKYVYQGKIKKEEYLNGNYMLRDMVFNHIRDKFEQFLSRDAETGDAESQFEMFGVLKQKDPLQAFVYLHKAASQMHFHAMYKLADMFYQHNCPVEGAKWLVKTKHAVTIERHLINPKTTDELYVYGKAISEDLILQRQIDLFHSEYCVNIYKKTKSKFERALKTWFLICRRRVFPISKDVRIMIAKRLILTKEKPSVWLCEKEINE